MKLIDESLGPDVNISEAEMVIKAALLCTNASPSLRPTMSEVVNMLEGHAAIPDMVPDPSSYNEDLRFKALRDFHQHRPKQSLSVSQTQHSVTAHTFTSTSGDNTYTSYIEDHSLVHKSENSPLAS